MTVVPEKWQRMLAELQLHDPKALLAGGAVRDLICNKIPRDLDFWITQPGVDWRHWGQMKRISFEHLSEYLTGNIEDAGVLQVWVIKPYRWLPSWCQTTINVIWCNEWKDPLDLIEKFDFGICMVAYDGKQIIRSRHFDHDYENKVFSLRRALDDHKVAKSIERYNKKFWPKYGWPMELSGQARLDQILRGLQAKGPRLPAWDYL